MTEWRQKRFWQILLLGAVLNRLSLFNALRSGELWLDEQWSLLLVQQAATPWELITKVRHDNNHLLNSLWMSTLGPYAPPELYRLPASLLALLSIVATWLVARWAGFGLAGIVWTLLVTVSYPLVVLTTEARGYSWAVCAAIVSFGLLVALRRKDARLGEAALFLVVSSIGLLSHATYLLFLVPALAWLLVERRREFLGLVSCVAVYAPLCVAGLLWSSFYGKLEIGGGPLAPLIQVLVSTISIAYGGEEMSAFDVEGSVAALGIACAVAVMLTVELVAWLRSKDPVAWLVAGVIACPLVVVVVTQPPFVMPRYFLLSVLFSYLVAARFVARLTSQGTIGYLVSLSLTALFMVGNQRHTAELARNGRSQLERAVKAIVSTDEPLTVGGDMDNQNKIRLDYMRLRRDALGETSYVVDYDKNAPKVVLREWVERGAKPEQTFVTSSGHTYELIQAYPAPLLSGSTLAVYSRR